jgi:hypothetical protein
MNTADAERRVRALAGAADLPREFSTWPGVLARLPRVRRRRRAVRAGAAATAVLALAAAVAVPLSLGAPQSAAAAARRAAAVTRTGAGLPPFELTEVITTAAIGFQPEPPPPRVTEHIEYADPSHWREQSTVTEPFHEGTQTFVQIRNGPLIASVNAGQVSIRHAAGRGVLPLSAPVAWRAALDKLRAAGSAGRCAPSASLSTNGPLIDRRPTVVLQTGPSPCPSADVPQANGPATFWLDKHTFLVLRAVLHGPGNRIAETITVTGLHYHVRFPAGTFRLPAPGRTPPPCRTATSLPDLAALRRALAYPPLIPARLPRGLRTGTIGTGGATTSRCKITTFTVTYVDSSGHPAVQLYEAPQASPSVRFPGRAVTIRPGLSGTLNSGSGMVILWWIQDGRYCALQSGGLTAGVRLRRIPVTALIHMAASLRA